MSGVAVECICCCPPLTGICWFALHTVCDCHVMGTVEGRCSFIDGQCDCRHGYRGLKCDLCEEGFYQIDGRCDGELTDQW